MPSNQNSALRIFLSSTAIDMVEHRKKVSETLLRLGNLPISMETFGVLPNEPVDVCKSKVLKSDAVIVMLAYRYGWVPTKQDGGDGKKSITWIEVETALENEIPLFAFILDENYKWPEPTEQDQLKNAKDQAEAIAIYERVQSLKEFKSFLESKANLTRDKFNTPEDLALKVSTSLSNWIISQAPIKKIDVEKTPFVFRTVHPLQPAPHFRGRIQLLDELKQWWEEPVTPDRVRSLVAIGGTGKTAVIERFLNSLLNERLRGGILVWSFYDEPNTDAFLNEACIVFTGKEPEGAGGKLEKLQRALASENTQHLIVLDGLERVQSEGRGTSGHAKGDLEDHRLKNLLRAIAAGLGNTRALITSRFKLTDLVQWEGAGYKSNELDILDKESAIEVLKAWNIKGDDQQLNKIAESVGRHALSVSVLGSYLANYCNYDPDDVKEFKLGEISQDEPLAARLARILGGYAKSLDDQEQDLLVRLSIFPKGVTVDILGYLINAGGEIAGTLFGINQKKLLTIAEKLKQQGLIYSYKQENTIVYSSHPFLREYFRNLLGVKSEDIHEVVRNKLAIGLDTKPKRKPSDIETLDKYERLIEYSILAGHYQEADALYYDALDGGGGHLFFRLADYGRIIRIISFFSADGTPRTITNQLSDNSKSYLINDWGLAAEALGDLKTADACFIIASELYQKSRLEYLAVSLINNADVAHKQGLLPFAKKLVEESFTHINDKYEDVDFVEDSKRVANGTLAYIFHLIGEVSLAKRHFAKATEINQTFLPSTTGFYEIEHLFAIGDHVNSLRRVKENFNYWESDILSLDIVKCHYLLGLLALPDSISKALEHLLKIRDWTGKTGHMESIISSYILASEIAYWSADYPAALAEATSGLTHAEGCGYGKLTIDLLLHLSKIHLAIPNYNTALSFARKAFDKSEHPECCYAWGEANALHLCGVCHKALGQYELARKRLTAALKIRKKIQHPEVEETRKLLAELPAI